MTADLLLIPPPADAEAGPESEAFTLDAGVPVEIARQATRATLFAAEQLQAAIRDATGLRLPLRKASDADARRRRIVLRVADSDSESESAAGAEGYTLQIGADGVSIAASDEAGLFYGVQTLRQLLRAYGARVPALTIRDTPVLAHRGLMLDISRGKVPKLETLLRLVDGLAACKYNQLQLYIEHTFDFPSHPEIGAGTDPLTAQDVLVLDRYCRERHVELVANFQSFGHQRHLLSLPRYSHLDEVGWRWSLTPAREETYQLLDELYSDFLPAFTSEWLNVDCDETWDLGSGQSKDLVREMGLGRVYLQHILRLRELAAKYGRRIMVWADVLHHHPELVAEVPDDILLLDWEYESAEHYPTTAVLGRSGRTFWVCPGTSSWNTLFPRLDNAVQNTQRFVRDGLANGATGMLLTDWGDYGHYLPQSLAWYPYLFGAATAWSGAQASPEAFERAFAVQFLGVPAGSAAVSAMLRLSRAVTAETLGLRNRSAIALALFDDPLNGPLAASVDPGALLEVKAAAHDAIRAWAGLPNADLRHDYGFSARLILFAAEKVMLTQRIHSSLVETGASARAALEDALRALGAMREVLPALRAEFELCWLRHARRSEIDLTLRHFDRLLEAFDEAVAWLEQRREAQTVDPRQYTPRPSAPLWLQGEQEMCELASLAGPDALP